MLCRKCLHTIEGAVKIFCGRSVCEECLAKLEAKTKRLNVEPRFSPRALVGGRSGGRLGTTEAR